MPGPVEPPDYGSMLNWSYWCRFHGRYELSSDVEACRTTTEIFSDLDGHRQRRSDPPSWWARLRRAFGIDVRP